MKHNEQSQQTKQALSEALKAMMKKKPLNKITVRELVEDWESTARRSTIILRIYSPC